jgi:hypothetical protein
VSVSQQIARPVGEAECQLLLGLQRRAWHATWQIVSAARIALGANGATSLIEQVQLERAKYAIRIALIALVPILTNVLDAGIE